LTNNTFALRADYTTGEDGSGLPVQVTLGGNNGLRAYDARQFEGRQRMRVNFESRYKPNWKLDLLDIGLVGFVDIGWAADRDDSSPSFNRSVGAGLRIGSSPILGSAVLRLDAAVPLDPPSTENDDPRFSFAIGQMFRF